MEQQRLISSKSKTQQQGWSEEELTDCRYIGVDPNNYVTFNGEEAGWRIIGIFTVENGEGEKEKRIKLVKKEYIGNMVWDSAGENDWSHASLMRQINPDTGETIFHLTRESQEMIGDTKWYLGATTWRNYYYDKGLTSNFYMFERGKEVYEGNSTYWIGKVGLMYVSDYGYATSGGSVTSQKSCLETKIYNWDNESISDCKNNDWLYSGKGQWTLVSRSEMGRLLFQHLILAVLETTVEEQIVMHMLDLLFFLLLLLSFLKEQEVKTNLLSSQNRESNERM